MFLAFLVAMFAVSLYGWIKGDPGRLLLGWDSDQNGCGYSPQTINYPYLYFPAFPTKDQIESISDGDYDTVMEMLNNGVCVSSCPTSNTSIPVDCYNTNETNTNIKYLNCSHYPLAT